MSHRKPYYNGAERDKSKVDENVEKEHLNFLR